MTVVVPELHSSAGVRIFACFPASPVFDDIRAAYSRLAHERPWLRLIDEQQFYELKEQKEWEWPDIVVFSWALVVAGRRRFGAPRAKVAVEYLEAIGGSRLLQHEVEWSNLRALSGGYDMLIGRSPWVAQQLEQFGLPTGILPLGWDPAMGIPDFNCAKDTHVAFYGSPCGKRLWTLPALTVQLQGRLACWTGLFGPRLTAKLNTAKMVLNLAHSDVESFSTWRAWQAASSSACLVAEPGDSWPFVPGKHYVELPRIVPENLEEIEAIIKALVDNPQATQEMASRAHEEVATRWKTESMVDNDLVTLAVKLRDTP